MGQRTLAFTRLLLREVSCNTLGKQSFIHHTCNRVNTSSIKGVKTHKCILGFRVDHYV
jgi:PII-like signaling protein